MRGKHFAKSNLSDLIPLPLHDKEYATDTLTTLTLNYKWRKFIADQLEQVLELNARQMDPLDFSVTEMFYLRMIEDLYT